MGKVMKIVEKKVGDAVITTTYHFNEFEDFLYWESGEGGNIEALTLSEDECEEASDVGGKEFVIVGNSCYHGFKEGEVVTLARTRGGEYIAHNSDGVPYYVTKEDVEQL